jgi:hypothetical protein
MTIPKIYQHFPFSGSPKFTQIGIFGLKTNHLANLLPSVFIRESGFSGRDILKIIHGHSSSPSSWWQLHQMMVAAMVARWYNFKQKIPI